MRIELADCTNHILREVADKRMKRCDIAQSYRLAMMSSEKTDWKRVNESIINRWSLFGLNWIKKEAWK